MAEIRIGTDWVAALEQYFEGLAVTTELASSRAATYLETETVSRAREQEGWDRVADHIEVWSQDGQLVVGVRDNEHLSEAWNLEFGDEVSTPNSIFRNMGATAEGVSKVMDQTFYEHYGWQV